MLPQKALFTSALAVVIWMGCATSRSPERAAPAAFQAFTNFSTFVQTDAAGAVTLLSPEIPAPHWNELIVSWNANCPARSRLTVEARAFDGKRWTRFYTMGIWSEDNVRESVRRQRDGDASVNTDVLVCKRPMRSSQVRLTLTGDAAKLPTVKFVGVSLLDTTMAPRSEHTNSAAYGRTLNVPQRSQLGYEGASGWCSPTSVSMMLAYWAKQLNRPELDVQVPAVATAVFDPNWSGTGNWPFNMAFAGHFAGVRAFVTRMNELGDVEDWIAAGVPVALSVSFDLLNGREKDLGNGHLIVVVGFTASGDVVVNDPWPSPKKENSVRKVFPRNRVIKAWQRSHQTAYVVVGEGR
jgi:uncharacterized protein YvpB